jgi:tryptophan-rich sensory protein
VTLPLQNASAWALAACFAAACGEGITAGTSVKSRFAELRFPRPAPQLWAWSVIGGAYYVLFFFLLRSLLYRAATQYWTAVALALTGMLLVANASWNWIFFRRRDLWLSFIFFVPYLCLALTLAAVLRRIRNPLLDWYLLYVGYLVYASWWGYRVWRLNSRSSPIG